MITITSFGYKHRKAEQAIHFDCRDLPNPYRNPRLKNLTGEDRAVQDFVLPNLNAQDMLKQAEAQAHDGCFISFGCMGGRHRSVAMAERLAKRLRVSGYTVVVHHLELD